MTALFKILEDLDKSWTLAFNSMHTPLTDVIWQVFSNQEIWYVLYLAVAVLMFRRLGWKTALVSVLAIALTVLACDQLANFTKTFFERLRPCWNPEMTSRGLRVLEDRGGLYGFYSAHAANAAGFVCCSLKCLKIDTRHNYNTYGRLMTVWFFFVGISRVFVGKHFLGDVIVGFAVGLSVGLLFGTLTSFLSNRIRRLHD